MKSKICFWLSALALFLSCTNSTDLTTYSINVKEDKPETDFFSGYSYIRLSDSTPMLSEVKDVRLSGDKIFVLDKTEKLFIFSKEGQFLNVIDKRGHGSNEYVEISDFDISNGSVYILSRTLKTIFEYKENGTPISKSELNDYYVGIRLIKPLTFLLASESNNEQKFNYIVYDSQKGTYNEKYLPFERNESMLLDSYAPFVGKNDDTWYLTCPYTTEIMKLTGEKVEPYRCYLFNTEEQLPDNISDLTFSQLYDMFSNKSVVKNISHFCATKSYEYIGYDLFGEYGISFHLSQIDSNGGTKTMMASNDIDKNFPYFSTPKNLDDNTFISVMDAMTVLAIEKNFKLDKFSSMGIKEGSNPIIFFHTLK